MRGITVDELLGFRDGILETGVFVPLDCDRYIDVVGTGGDRKNTFNISTTSCFVIAGAGYKVAKHGNFSATSVSGASNVIKNHGAVFTDDIDKLNRSINECGIVYLHAQLFAKAMKFVGAIRRALPFPYVLQPAGAHHQPLTAAMPVARCGQSRPDAPLPSGVSEDRYRLWHSEQYRRLRRDFTHQRFQGDHHITMSASSSLQTWASTWPNPRRWWEVPRRNRLHISSIPCLITRHFRPRKTSCWPMRPLASRFWRGQEVYRRVYRHSSREHRQWQCPQDLQEVCGAEPLGHARPHSIRLATNDKDYGYSGRNRCAQKGGNRPAQAVCLATAALRNGGSPHQERAAATRFHAAGIARFTHRHHCRV